MKWWAFLTGIRIWQRSICHRNRRLDCCVGQLDGLDEPRVSLPALGTWFCSASTWRLFLSFVLWSSYLLAFQISEQCGGKLLCSGPRDDNFKWGRSKEDMSRKPKQTSPWEERIEAHERLFILSLQYPGRGLESLTGVSFALKTALWQCLVQGHRTQKCLMEQIQHE